MKFRSRLFGVLFIFALLWMCGGAALTSSAFQQTLNRNPNADDTTANTAYAAGATIGGGIGLTFFLCSGLPFAALFGLLSWRNSVGLRREQMHKEQIEAIKSGKP